MLIPGFNLYQSREIWVNMELSRIITKIQLYFRIVWCYSIVKCTTITWEISRYVYVLVYAVLSKALADSTTTHNKGLSCSWILTRAAVEKHRLNYRNTEWRLGRRMCGKSHHRKLPSLRSVVVLLCRLPEQVSSEDMVTLPTDCYSMPNNDDKSV